VSTGRRPIPVILDTDIGGDIDDTWALGMLLKSPELDLKMVVADTGDTVYRAKIIARMLEIAGRTDVPVGIGLRQPARDYPQAPWVDGYELARYPGKVFEDGVEAMIRLLMDAPEPITLICIGPVPNIGAALEREPRIAARTRFVGMHGSIRRQHDGKEGAIAEYNVVTDVPACQKAFSAPWQQMRITPLDTCGRVRLTGEPYKKARDATDPVARAVIENYRIWAKAHSWSDAETASSILFDTVAIHLAYSTRYLVMEKMRLRVTDDGFTVPDANAREMNVAIDWADLPAYETFLANRMVRPVVRLA